MCSCLVYEKFPFMEYIPIKAYFLFPSAPSVSPEWVCITNDGITLRRWLGLSCTIEDPNNMRCLRQIYRPRVESPGKDVRSNNGLGWRLFQYLRVLERQTAAITSIPLLLLADQFKLWCSITECLRCGLPRPRRLWLICMLNTLSWKMTWGCDWPRGVCAICYTTKTSNAGWCLLSSICHKLPGLLLIFARPCNQYGPRLSPFADLIEFAPDRRPWNRSWNRM